MKNVAIFYASNTGKTKDISDEISKHLEEIKEYNIKVTGCEYMQDYENIILGISTWEDGFLQEGWKKVWEEFKTIDFTNKTVAIFGLGDQKKYPNTFCDALRPIYEQLIQAKAKVVGFTENEDYNFKASKALVNNKFVGLVLDLDNQSELTIPRIESWVKDLKKDFK